MTDETEEGVRTSGLGKRYGRTMALENVTLAIPRGSVALLVGPNGAGKSTLLRLLMDLTPPDAGDAHVLGLDPRADGARIRAATGYVPEHTHFPFDRVNGRDVLDFHRRFREGWDREHEARLVERLDVPLHTAWRGLSKGARRKVQLVAALAPRPDLLLMDEGTDGLDPVARRGLFEILVEQVADTGATVVYSTHVVHEVQSLADHLVVLRDGRVRIDESAESLHRTHYRIRIASARGEPSRPSWLLLEETRGRERQWIVDVDEQKLRSWAAREGVELRHASPVSLEEVAMTYLTIEKGGGAPPPHERAREEVPA